MNRIYFDYAASTPVDPAVADAMTGCFSQKFGNPGSLHYFGQEAMAVIDESREKIAKAIGASPAGGFREIIFTGSATEANNLALRGIIKGVKRQMSNVKYPRIIVSAIEHESILETCRDLEKEGVETIYLPVNREGIVDLKKLKEFLNDRTVLVSIMYANNETGTIQPIAEIAKIIREFKETKSGNAYPLFHADAVQAFQFLDCGVNGIGVDLMTLSAHKIYGPKGIGLLCARQSAEHKARNEGFAANGSRLAPIITGGGQEFGLRSGTENTASIAGFAKAIELADKNRLKEAKRIGGLTKYFFKEIKKIYPAVKMNAAPDKKKLPNILNIFSPGQRADDLFIKLDMAGIAVSSGSACSARSTKLSHVLAACGFSEKRIKSSLRFSFGRFTIRAEINEALKRIKIAFRST